MSRRNNKNLRRLLELYFEGETSLRQEERLRRIFLAESLPEDLEQYRPLFGFVEQERAGAVRKPSLPEVRSGHRYILTVAVSVACAAAVLSAVGVFVFDMQDHADAGFELMIEGRGVADEALAVEIADQGLSRLMDLQAALDRSLGMLQVTMEKSESTVAEMEVMVLSKFKMQ